MGLETRGDSIGVGGCTVQVEGRAVNHLVQSVTSSFTVYSALQKKMGTMGRPGGSGS